MPNLPDKIRITKIDLPDDGYGIFTYCWRFKYPYNGYPDERVVNQVATFKRALVHNLKLLVTSPFKFFMPFVLLLPPLKRAFLFQSLTWFGNMSIVAFENTKYQYDDAGRFCRFCREIYRSGMELVAPFKESHQQLIFKPCVVAVCMFLEFDNSYRYRAQDILSDLDKSALIKNPREEIVRLFELGLSREKSILTDSQSISEVSKRGQMDLGQKWRMLIKLLKVVLFFSPAAVNLARKFLLELKISEVRFDENDWYWIYPRSDYNFGGFSIEELNARRDAIDEEYFKTLGPEPPDQSQISLVVDDEFYKLTEEKADQLLASVNRKAKEGWKQKQ